jgi:hypothetical protein
MSNFQVPQFIEERPKIVGPLTLPQFLYVAAGALVSLITYYTVGFSFIWIVVTSVMGVVALALAFIKIEGQELPKLLISAFDFLLKPKTYLWARPDLVKTIDVPDLENLRNRMGFQEKLKSIALNITTGRFFANGPRPSDNAKKYQIVTYLTGEKRLAKRVDY